MKEAFEEVLYVFEHFKEVMEAENRWSAIRDLRLDLDDLVNKRENKKKKVFNILYKAGTRSCDDAAIIERVEQSRMQNCGKNKRRKKKQRKKTEFSLRCLVLRDLFLLLLWLLFWGLTLSPLISGSSKRMQMVRCFFYDDLFFFCLFCL